MPASATAFVTLIAAPPSAGAFLQPNTTTVPRVGQTFPLVPGKNLLGRGAGATIVLPWMFVSRQHAVIEFFLLGSWEIEDLQSRNGTFVNGQRLSAQTLAVLNEGDHICLAGPGSGAFEFLFTFQPVPQLTREEEYERFLEMDDFSNEPMTE
jgi:hypothetical protein